MEGKKLSEPLLLLMQIISFVLAFGCLFALARGHPGHEDQLPLNYVKFPLQPIYRGRNGEGKLPSHFQK